MFDNIYTRIVQLKDDVIFISLCGVLLTIVTTGFVVQIINERINRFHQIRYSH